MNKGQPVKRTKPSIDFLKDHLRAVARPRDILGNPDSLQAVETYIIHSLESYGYTVHRHPFEVEGKIFHNLSAGCPLGAPRPKLIVGAHFDAVGGSPGADDNASGIAGLLEAARLLACDPCCEALSFIAFNAEEYGMLGSKALVAAFRQEKIPVAGMISLEMIGYSDTRPGSQDIPAVLKPFYPNTGDFLALVGAKGCRKILKCAETSYKLVKGLKVETLSLPGKGHLLPAVRLSDHSPFWDAGFPALLVTDTSFFRNPHYHHPSDTVETLDLDFLARVTEGTVCFARAFTAPLL